MTCSSCHREGLYRTVAVRALVAASSPGEFLTLSIVSAGGGASNTCTCGRVVQRTYAAPVPLGIYKITTPTVLTKESGR